VWGHLGAYEFGGFETSYADTRHTATSTTTSRSLRSFSAVPLWLTLTVCRSHNSYVGSHMLGPGLDVHC